MRNKAGAVSHGEGFCYRPIDDCILSRMRNKSYKPEAGFSLDELVYVEVLHYDFNNEIANGELVVNRKIAEKVLCVFEELFAIRYPIEKMILIDEYGADDDCSMADSNSSAFNYRTIAGTSKLSNHALGMAIDINPLYNPYIQVKDGETNIYPANGVCYVDRELENPYYIHKSDSCYEIFARYGFSWGGDWSPSKDYQHFEF